MEITKEMINKLTDDVLNQYKQEVGNLSFPINEQKLVTAIKKLKGVEIKLEEVKEETFVGLNEGVLIPKKRGFIIKYGVNPYKGTNRIFSPIVRKRFTICHELAHILFYDCKKIIPEEYRKPEEYICDEIARRFLLPEELLRLEFQKYKPDTNLLPFLRKIAKKAKVSLYPLVKRIVEDSPLLENVMITFWYLKQPNDKEPQTEASNVILDRVDSKISQNLKHILTPYWRRLIREYVWNEAVKMIIDNIKKAPVLLPSIRIESKKRKKGELKYVQFNVECDFYAQQRPLFRWDHLFTPQLVSVEKFEEVQLWL